MFMRNQIRELREARSWSQSDLGDLIGVHWQTISRIERSRTRLMEKRERAIAEAFGIAPDDLYVKDPGHSVRSVRVQQHVQAGAFSESNLWPDDEGYEVLVPDDERLRNYGLYGSEVRGPSMNKIYPEGTVLIFTNIFETREHLELGKRYIVERERADGLRESSVKTLQKDQDGAFWLVPESDDPRFGPIPVDNGAGDTVRVIGKVEYSVRRE